MKKDYTMINAKLTQMLSKPLAMNESAARALRSFVHSAQTHSMFDFTEDEKGVHISHQWTGLPVPAPYDLADGTRVIPVHGVMSRCLGMVGEYFGFADIDNLAGWIRDAGNDSTVSRIALHVRSPGGDAQGNFEAGAALVQAGKKKPTLAFCDELMCSAAYFLGSAAHTIYATPSAMVGNIGSYIVLADDSEFWKKMGVEFLVLRSGEYKGAGIDGYTDDQLTEIQGWADAFGTQFRSFVHAQRPTISEENMKGQIFIGKELTYSGICDFTALTMQDALTHNLKFIGA